MDNSFLFGFIIFSENETRKEEKKRKKKLTAFRRDIEIII